MNDSNWDNVRKLFRQACFLRATGDESAAVKILGSEMPGAVSAWTQKSDLSDADRKLRLQSMFQEEMQKVDESIELCDHMMARFEASFQQQIGTILYDLQLLIYHGLGLDPSNIRTPEYRPVTPVMPVPAPVAKPSPVKGKTKELPETLQPEEGPKVPPKIPRLDPKELAEKLTTFTQARKAVNKDWQSILFNDLEKIIDTVLNEPPKSPSK
jgi:hypothetical protein